MLGEEAVVHHTAQLSGARLGRFVEIAEGARILDSEIGDYSYTERYVDIANASVGKFANIASFVRIGATDHPMDRASLHHFQYRSARFWADAEDDAAFFAARATRRATIGHDTWLGHGAMVMPEVSVGHGAVVAAMAVVTRDVAPFAIVAGVPAREVRRRHSESVAARLIALGWWDWDHARLRAALADFRALSVEAFLERHEGAR